MRKTVVVLIVIAAIIGLGFYLYSSYKHKQELENPQFYQGNGRLEATEVYIASKIAGKIEKVYVKEGDRVKKGDKLVQMQTNTLEADKASVEATIKVLEGKLAMAEASEREKQSTFNAYKKEYERQQKLRYSNANSQQDFDAAEAHYLGAKADLDYADASIKAAKGEIEKAKAELQHIEADIADSLLVATYDGRIQYLLAHEGEVLSAGGRALNLIDMTDVYFTFFLPTKIVGKLQMGSEVKIVFDADPTYAFSAKITFIDPSAQFTPKSVETQIEREKLMFRVKAHLDKEMLSAYMDQVKTGLPGVAWVKVNPDAKWEASGMEIDWEANNAMDVEIQKDLERAAADKAAADKAAAEAPAKEAPAADKAL